MWPVACWPGPRSGPTCNPGCKALKLSQPSPSLAEEGQGWDLRSLEVSAKSGSRLG